MFFKIRYIVILTIFLLISSFSCKDEKIAARDKDSSVKWENISTVFKNNDNKKNPDLKKPVLIFFYTEWCTFCKKMDKETFNNNEIAQYMNENYINIRVNPEKENSKIKVMEKDLTPYELMMHTGAQGFPTTLFFNDKMKPLTVIPGYVENKTFLLILKYLKEEWYNKNVSMDDYIKNSE
ncbi:MAG: thioredoxin fold domain-containing protein [Spirochaetes bacterium]|nr:thioredoxin fold domain-containing protein [Spirochaetota bacterium]